MFVPNTGYIFRETFPLNTDPLSKEHPYLLSADWSAKGQGVIMVRDYDIFYRPSPRSNKVYRITDTAIPGVISNGVADWLYEGKVYYYML